MKIYTESLRKYSKTFGMVRIPKHAYFGAVHIDGAKGKLSFRNENIVFSINLEVEGTIESPIYITEGDKFFALVNSVDYLELEKGIFKTPTGDKFNISSFEEEFPEVSFNNSDWDEIDFPIDDETITYMRKSQPYIAGPETPEYHGLFFQSDWLIAIQPSKMFARKFSFPIDGVKIPADLVRVLTSIDAENIKIFVDSIEDSSSFILRADGLNIKFTTDTQLALPVDINSEDYRASFEHETSFTVGKDSLMSVIRFLDPFVRDLVCSRCQINFFPEDNQLEFVVQDESNLINYKESDVEFSDPEYFKDKYVTLSLLILATNISNLEGDKIQITFDEDRPAMKLSAPDQNELFIIQTRLMDE
jgi:hypothetical protein